MPEETKKEHPRNLQLCQLECLAMADHAGFLLAYYLTLKMEGTCFPQKLVNFLLDYTALYPRRQNSSIPSILFVCMMF
jgi:hypothetical protein